MSKIHFVTLSVLLILSVLTAMVFGAGQGNPKIAAQFKDQNLRELYLHYTMEPTRKTRPSTTAAQPDLPPPLQTMITQGQANLLDEILNTCQNMLLQQGARLNMLVELFPPDAARTYAEELAQLLDRVVPAAEGGNNIDVAGYLKIVEGALADLHRYLDWYPGEDWYQRFGSNGFYDHTWLLWQRLVLTKSMLAFYRAGLYRYRSVDQKHIIAELTQSFQELADLHRSPNHLLIPTETVRLWLVRLARSLARYKPKYLDYARRQLDILLQGPTSPELEYDLRLESLRCAAINNKDRDIRLQVENLKNWLNAKKGGIQAYPDKLLQLFLLEYHLINRDLREGWTDVRQLKPFFNRLQALAGQYPQLHSTISYFIAGCLNEAFNAASDADQFARNWSDFNLMALGRFYQSDPSRYDAAIRLYESFLRIRFPGQRGGEVKNGIAVRHYPRVLYDLALCHYQLGRHCREIGDEEKTIKETIEAINTWNRLSSMFPHWSSGQGPQQVSSAKSAGLAGSLAYNLFVTDTEEYGDLARRTLAILVGRIEAGRSEPEGAFAQTETAKKYRFYYALTLQNAQEYTPAADMFAAVPADDANKFTARYHTVFCRFQQYENSAPCMRDTKTDHAVLSPAQTDSLYQPLIAELKQLICEKPGSSLSVKAVWLLCQLYRKTNQIESAIPLVRQALKTNPRDTQLLTLTLNLLHEQRTGLLLLHAQGLRRELIQSLVGSLPLVRKIYESFRNTPQDNRFPFALRIYLEYLTLSSVNIDEAGPVPDLAPVESLLARGREITEIVSQLWFIRCQALFTFAQGEYAESQKLWYRIRQATTDKEDKTNQYYWWEARYFGLRCLMTKNKPDQVAHIIEVLLRTRSDYTGLWLDRLKQLQQLAKNSA